MRQQGSASKRRGVGAQAAAAGTETERVRPAMARPITPSRRALLKGAGAMLITSALLATGEVVPVPPFRVAAADPPARPSGPGAVPAAPDTLYQCYLGTDFQPEITTQGETAVRGTSPIPASGPIFASLGVSSFSARLHLPQGATITEVLFFVVHSDLSGMNVAISSHNPTDLFAGPLSVSAPVFASLNVQTVSLSTVGPGFVVDNSQYAYVLEWQTFVGGIASGLYGARVAYTLPGNAQVYGSAQAGVGVRGDSATGNGVIGNTAGTGTVAGVLGSTNPALLSDQRAAVAGMSDVATVPALYGHATVAPAAGVLALATGASSVGVYGQADDASGTGMKGLSGAGFPIIGQVAGTGSGGNINAGVLGAGTVGPGAQGQSGSGHGVVGTTKGTGGHAGVVGNADNAGGVGVMGIAPGYGTGTVGHAGVFYGNVAVAGTVSAPVLQATVRHAGDNSKRLLYGTASPESWLEDFGKAKLVNSIAHVTLDPDFAALVHADDYHVFLTEYDDSNNLYVTQVSASGFVVQAKAPVIGAGVKAPTKEVNSTFSYRVVAKRKDITSERLAKAATPAAPPVPVTFTVPDTTSVAPTKKP